MIFTGGSSLVATILDTFGTVVSAQLGVNIKHCPFCFEHGNIQLPNTGLDFTVVKILF